MNTNNQRCAHELMPGDTAHHYTPCPRTFAIYRPGVPLPGVAHHFAWSGSMPCTGTLRCTLCGMVS